MNRILILLTIIILSLLLYAATTVLNSFSAGELSPLLEGRTDTKAYYKGCRTFENFLVMSQGGAMKRPGTQYMAQVKDSNYPVRLMPFEYSSGDTYIIEAGNLYMRFFRSGGQILTGTSTETNILGDVVSHWLLNDNEAATTALDNEGLQNGRITARLTSLNSQDIHSDEGTDGCFDLDGKCLVLVADNAAYSFTDNTSDEKFSITGWVYVTDSDERQTILSKWHENNEREYRLYLDEQERLCLDLHDDTVDISANLIAHYKCNENAANKIVDNAQGTAARDGVATANTSVLTTTGKTSTAFNLANAYAIEINDLDAFTFNTAGQDLPFSISAWVYLNSNDSGVILAKYSLLSTDYREYVLGISTDKKLFIDLWDESRSSLTPSVIQTAANDSLSLCTWLYIVVTYDGSESEDGLNLYVNNVLVDQTKLMTEPAYQGMENLESKTSIGAYYDSSGVLGSFLDAKIDNVMVFNIELSPSQIASLWNSGAGTESTSGAGIVQCISDDSLTSGWHYVAATYSAPSDPNIAADGITLYVDGKEIASTAYNNSEYTAMQDTTTAIRLGGQKGSSGLGENYWKDKIDNIAIYNDDLTAGEVLSLYAGTPYEITTPYTQSELSTLQFIQSADQMYIAHPNHPISTLTRYDHTVWEIEEVDYRLGPFKEENDDRTITIDPPAKSSDITTAAGYIESGHYATFAGSEAFDNDTNTCNMWYVASIADCWVGQLFSSAKIIKRIKIWPYDSANADAQPKIIWIEASTDGVAYVKIPIERYYGRCEGYNTNEVYIDQFASLTTYIELYLDNDVAYKYWRIWCDSNWGDATFTGILEVEMCEADSGVYTASSDIFNSNHVDSLWKLRYPVESSDVKGSFAAFTTGISESIPIYGSWDFITHASWTGTVEIQKSYDFGATWITYRTFDSEKDFNVNLADEETELDVWYRVACTMHTDGTPIKYNLSSREGTKSGIIRVTSYIDPCNVVAEVLSEIESREPTYRWSEGSWSADEGYPAAISFYEERFCAAGTTNQPQTIWLSKTDNWNDFYVGTYDDAALELTLASDQVDGIKWLSPQSRLLIGTSGGEWTLSASAPDEALTATNLTAKRQSTNGCADIQAVAMNNLVFFLQRPGRKIRSFRYSFDIDNWIAHDETIISEHITYSGITQLALQKNPYPILWCVRNDGELVGMTFEESQEVVGWHRHTFDGNVESVARMPGSDEDEIWLEIERTIDSVTRRYIERVKPFDWGSDQNDIWFVDSGLEFNISDTNTVAGLDHLEGETVAIVGDGIYRGTDVVTGGIVSWNGDVNEGCIGLPYTAKLLPMKLAEPSAPGQLVGSNKRITEVILRLYKSLDWKVGDSWTDYDSYCDYLDSDEVYDSNYVYTGDINIEFDGDKQTSGDIYIQSDLPLPLNILALKAVFDKED